MTRIGQRINASVGSALDLTPLATSARTKPDGIRYGGSARTGPDDSSRAVAVWTGAKHAVPTRGRTVVLQRSIVSGARSVSCTRRGGRLMTFARRRVIHHLERAGHRVLSLR